MQEMDCFESWWVGFMGGCYPHRILKEKDAYTGDLCYIDVTTQCAWLGYQAKCNIKGNYDG